MADLARFQDIGGGGIRRDGNAGGCSSACSVAGDRAGRLGSRGGRDGRGGSAILDTVDGDLIERGGAHPADAAASSFALASSSRRVGGRGGSLAMSRVGGSRRVGCSEPTLVAEDTVWFRDVLDTVDM